MEGILLISASALTWTPTTVQLTSASTPIDQCIWVPDKSSRHYICMDRLSIGEPIPTHPTQQAEEK